MENSKEQTDKIEFYYNYSQDKQTYMLTFLSNFELDNESLLEMFENFVVQIQEGVIDLMDPDCEWSEQ